MKLENLYPDDEHDEWFQPPGETFFSYDEAKSALGATDAQMAATRPKCRSFSELRRKTWDLLELEHLAWELYRTDGVDRMPRLEAMVRRVVETRFRPEWRALDRAFYEMRA